MLELKDFEAAYNKVQEVVLPTKLIKSDYFSDQTGNDVYQSNDRYANNHSTVKG